MKRWIELKILHVITTIERGGAEKQLLTLVEKQIKSGKDVAVLNLKGLPDLKEEFESIGATVITSLSNRNIFIQIHKLRQETFNSYDVIHAHLPLAEILVALCKKKDTRLVATRHNVESFYPRAENFISTLISRIVLSRFNGVICISKAVQTYLSTRKEIPNGKLCEVIYYGFDEKITNRHLRVNRFPLHEIREIGTISRLVNQKDLTTLISGFELAKQKFNIKLTIVGRGLLEKDLKDFAQKRNLSESITWFRQVEDVGEFYNAIDIFALTSKYEGLGLVLIEAMQFGVPIIAAKNSAIVEVLGEDYKYLFETSNPLSFATQLQILIEDLMSGNFGNYALQLKNFNPIIMEKQIDKFYKECGIK